MVLRGKYRLDRVLGVGGMAVVFKATHRNQAEFAIKMLHPELSLSEDLRQRFLREGYAANSVRHPGVVRVVDDDVAEDGAAFLVMELLDGVACDNLCDNQSEGGRRLSLEATCSIGLELLQVLAAAHAQGIVHRDIKPANLFLLRDGSLKVLDFGIARIRDTMGGSAQATGTGMLLGTPAFMSPEQALGKASDIDARADIWAVGATIFGLTSGENVHEAETAPQLLIKLATQPPRSFASVAPHAPAPIVAAVQRALAFDKAARWPSAQAKHDALETAVRTTHGAFVPRAVLASVVATHLGSRGNAPVVAAPTAAAFASTTPAPSYGGAMPYPTPHGAGFSGVAAPSAPLVDTGIPVSRERTRAGARRSASRVLLVVFGIAALALGLFTVILLRGRKPTSSAASTVSIAPVGSTSPGEVSASQPTAAPPVAATAATGPQEASGGDAVAPSPTTTRKQELTHANVPTHVAIPHTAPPPTAKVEPAAPPPHTSLPAAATPAAPRADPLDGRR